MKTKHSLQFIVSVLVCEAAGIVGSVFTMESVGGWYTTLAKPALNPDSSVFGPVWTTLYFCMGVALFLIWRALPEKSARRIVRAVTQEGGAEALKNKIKKTFLEYLLKGRIRVVTRKKVFVALWIFALQLALNVAWSFLFFGLHNPALAFLDIILLLLAIIWTMHASYKVSPGATFFLVPYLFWVLFAAYLNYAIWMLN